MSTNRKMMIHPCNKIHSYWIINKQIIANCKRHEVLNKCWAKEATQTLNDSIYMKSKSRQNWFMCYKLAQWWPFVGRLERAWGVLGAGDAPYFDVDVGYMDVHLVKIHQAVLLGYEHCGRYIILPKKILKKKSVITGHIPPRKQKLKETHVPQCLLQHYLQ